MRGRLQLRSCSGYRFCRREATPRPCVCMLPSSPAWFGAYQSDGGGGWVQKTQAPVGWAGYKRLAQDLQNTPMPNQKAPQSCACAGTYSIFPIAAAEWHRHDIDRSRNCLARCPSPQDTIHLSSRSGPEYGGELGPREGGECSDSQSCCPAKKVLIRTELPTDGQSSVGWGSKIINLPDPRLTGFIGVCKNGEDGSEFVRTP